MKKSFMGLVFLLLVGCVTTVASAQLAPAGQGYGGDPAYGAVATKEAPTKLTGVLDKIQKYRNGLKLTIAAANKKYYQYSVYYAGQGFQTALSVDKGCAATLNSLDDLKVNDVVFLKLNGTNVKSLVLKERPADIPATTTTKPENKK